MLKSRKILRAHGVISYELHTDDEACETSGSRSLINLDVGAGLDLTSEVDHEGRPGATVTNEMGAPSSTNPKLPYIARQSAIREGVSESEYQSIFQHWSCAERSRPCWLNTQNHKDGAISMNSPGATPRCFTCATAAMFLSSSWGCM